MPPKRLAFLEVLRGLACIWVIFNHAYNAWGPQLPESAPGLWRLAALIAHSGYLGVHLFLVISGFCLCYPLISRQPWQDQIPDWTLFFKRRATRIWPPYFVALVLVLVSEAYLNPREYPHGTAWVSNVAMHVAMVHNLSPATIGSFNSSLWSLALECQLYLIFPLLLAAARLGGLRALLLGSFGISIAWQLAVLTRLGIYPEWAVGATWYHALPGRCFEFAAGMAAAALVARPHPKQTRLAILSGCVSLPVALFLTYKVSRFAPLFDQCWGLLFAASIVTLAAAPPALFENRVVRAFGWFGTVSYSVYLIHQPLLRYMRDWVAALNLPPAGVFLFLVLVVIPALAALGYLFHLAFERPFMRRRDPSARSESARKHIAGASEAATCPVEG
ncbi:MAG: acyltransferase [Arthrobacter sp.]|nr:acyltransferase [Arthrobacter sp.]